MLLKKKSGLQGKGEGVRPKYIGNVQRTSKNIYKEK